MTELLITIAHDIGYIGIFTIVFFESGFPATFFLPGDSLLFTLGFLASKGEFNLYLLIPVIFVAGFVGYLLGYALGVYLEERLFSDKPSFWFNRKRLLYAKEFFDTYGVKTIFLGRFVPVVRSFGPTIAGAVGMPYKKFFKYAFIGALVWSIGVTTLGFYLGSSFPQIHSHISLIIILIVVVSLMPTLVEYFLKRRRQNN